MRGIAPSSNCRQRHKHPPQLTNFKFQSCSTTRTSHLDLDSLWGVGQAKIILCWEFQYRGTLLVVLVLLPQRTFQTSTRNAMVLVPNTSCCGTLLYNRIRKASIGCSLKFLDTPGITAMLTKEKGKLSPQTLMWGMPTPGDTTSSIQVINTTYSKQLWNFWCISTLSHYSISLLVPRARAKNKKHQGHFSERGYFNSSWTRI